MTLLEQQREYNRVLIYMEKHFLNCYWMFVFIGNKEIIFSAN